MKLRIVPMAGCSGALYWALEKKWFFGWTRCTDLHQNKNALIALANHLQTPPEYFN